MSRQFLHFIVRGVEPAPQGSKRHVGNGVMIEASKKVAPFRAAVADAVHHEFMASGDTRPITDPCVVWATFYLPKPPSVKRLWPSVMPDTDKLCRSLGDGMSVNTDALADDSLIVRWVATKVYAATPADIGVRVTIRTVDKIMEDNGFVTFNEMLQYLDNHH